MQFVLWSRRMLARRARFCVLPNQQRAEHFTQEMGNPDVVCVWNCPTRDEISAARLGCRREDLWVLYHGSIVPVRLPAAVLQALAMLPGHVKLRVIGYETAGQ